VEDLASKGFIQMTEEMENARLWTAEPLNEVDRKRLGRVLHQRSRKLNILRLGDGSRISVNGATFDFGGFMATLRQAIADPGDGKAATAALVGAPGRPILVSRNDD
jgi:hypothetical protein